MPKRNPKKAVVAKKNPQNDHRTFNKRMEQVMLLSEGDVGVFWKDGHFYLSGAKELDDALISDPSIGCLGIRKFKNNSVLRWSIIKNRSLVVRRVRMLLPTVILAWKRWRGNSYGTKTFDNNSDALIAKLGLPKEYGNIIHYYKQIAKQIAHEYGSRHAGSDPSHGEVEAFVYLSGLLMRLLTQAA